MFTVKTCSESYSDLRTKKELHILRNVAASFFKRSFGLINLFPVVKAE